MTSKPKIPLLSVLLWGGSWAGIILFLLSDTAFDGTWFSSRIGELAVFTASTILMWLGSLYFVKQGKTADAERIMRKTFTLLFVFFCVMIIGYTLFDSAYGRDFSRILHLDADRIKKHFDTRCNFVPFRTVCTIIKGAANGALGFSDVVVNLAGNLLIFTPFAFYLPTLFRRMKKFLPFFAAISLIVLSIELLQTVTTVGSGDIDDYILNVGGTCLVWAVLRGQKTQKLCRKLTVIPIF